MNECFINKKRSLVLISFFYFTVLNFSGCAHRSIDNVSPDEAAKLNRSLVRDAVVFEPGTAVDAVVPEVSAPRLRAQWIEEHLEQNGSVLVEKHRIWLLDGTVSLLGIPKEGKK